MRLRQEIAGVPVTGGSVNVLFDTLGRLLSVDALALVGELSGFSPEPQLGAVAALERAGDQFRADSGVFPGEIRAPRLTVAQLVEGKRRAPRLAWEVEALRIDAGAEPLGLRYLIDARSGALLQRRRAVHHFDVSGQVRSLATPGLAPDQAGNAPTSQPMPHLRVEQRPGQRRHRRRRQVHHRRRQRPAGRDRALRRHLRRQRQPGRPGLLADHHAVLAHGQRRSS